MSILYANLLIKLLFSNGNPRYERLYAVRRKRSKRGIYPRAQVAATFSPTQADKDVFAAEDARKFGYKRDNYNLRAAEIACKINQAVDHIFVRHSDEAGRPGIDAVDMPLIAFIPDGTGTICCIETVEELDKLMFHCIQLGFVSEYNKAWFAEIFAKRHGYLPGGSVDDLMRTAPKISVAAKEAPF